MAGSSFNSMQGQVLGDQFDPSRMGLCVGLEADQDDRAMQVEHGCAIRFQGHQLGAQVQPISLHVQAGAVALSRLQVVPPTEFIIEVELDFAPGVD